MFKIFGEISMGKKKEIQSIKVCVIGGEGVGKYSLSQQFAKGWIEPKETNSKLIKS